MLDILKRILRGEVFFEHDRERLRKLVALNGITQEQQEELYELSMKMDDRVFYLLEKYLQNGAVPVYTEIKNDHT